ncbi:MAG: hypothetical protein NT099_07590 [Candidatus Saganbacteria bacterium]|nr:hypothetical protein [Candidatus Saganbacteria bacterium]
MKKLILCILFLTVILGSSAFAMLDVAAEIGQLSVSNTSKTGYGVQIGLPLLPIPMVNTRLEAMYYSLDSTSNLIPINLNADFRFPMTPIYVGAGIGYMLYNNTAGITAPGAMIYNAHIGGIYDLAPMTSLFAELGYQGGTMDLSVAGVSIGKIELNGTSIKGGIRFGI